jgi:hypothetical protein
LGFNGHVTVVGSLRSAAAAAAAAAAVVGMLPLADVSQATHCSAGEGNGTELLRKAGISLMQVGPKLSSPQEEQAKTDCGWLLCIIAGM